jgi:hypothetical protein
VARRLRANVNLIRYNEVRGLPFSRPATADVRAFQAALRSRGVNAHIRASRGRDIAAACGQLRHEQRGPSPVPAPVPVPVPLMIRPPEARSEGSGRQRSKPEGSGVRQSGSLPPPHR